MSTLPQTDYVGTLDNLVYVIVGSREKFDAIPVPEDVHKNGCHSKIIGDFKTAAVIFQWWPAAEAPIANAGETV